MMEYDALLQKLSRYVCAYSIHSQEAYDTALLCLADSIGCAALALTFPACTKLLGPVIPETIVPNGVPIPGTHYILDPIRAAFNIGTMIRWLDYNDTWLAAEWGHPSDNLGALLPAGDYLSRNGHSFTVNDLLTAIIKAYEIQGCLAIENSFNQIGFDHVLLVKLASACVSAHILGANEQQVADTASQCFIDTGPLRTYRHAPNTGSRKSWAAGDACSRGLQLAWMTLQGEMGYPNALTSRQWGFQDVLLKGAPLRLERPLDSYVMENILFKVSFPAEFHAQTAVECAITLYSQIKERIDDIEEILIETHKSALRIIDKQGPLRNPADRDHCLQYMTAIGLIHGALTADHYEDRAAEDPRIDRLREKMKVVENSQFSLDYLDLDKRSIANALTIKFRDGTSLKRVCVEYPLGHRIRRKESYNPLMVKLENNLRSIYTEDKTAEIIKLFKDPQRLIKLQVSELLDVLSKKPLPIRSNSTHAF